MSGGGGSPSSGGVPTTMGQSVAPPDYTSQFNAAGMPGWNGPSMATMQNQWNALPQNTETFNGTTLSGTNMMNPAAMQLMNQMGSYNNAYNTWATNTYGPNWQTPAGSGTGGSAPQLPGTPSGSPNPNLANFGNMTSPGINPETQWGISNGYLPQGYNQPLTAQQNTNLTGAGYNPEIGWGISQGYLPQGYNQPLTAQQNTNLMNAGYQPGMQPTSSPAPIIGTTPMSNSQPPPNPFQMRQFPQFSSPNGAPPQVGSFNFQQTPQASQPNWAAISQLPANGLPSVPTPPPMTNPLPGPSTPTPPANPLANMTPQQQMNFVQGYGGTAPRFSDAWAAAPSMYPGLNNQNLFLQNMAQLQAGMPGMGG